MTKPAACWLSALLVAAISASASLCAKAEETGPEKADSPKAVEPARPNKGVPRSTYPFRGVVASFDASAQALKLEGKGAPRIVQVTAQTRLTRQGSPATVADLNAGEPVGGTLRKTAEGREEAVLIRIGPKPEAEEAPGSDGETGGGKRPRKKESAGNVE